MSLLISDFSALDFRIWFDLATPDPEFSGFTVEPEDQLPGRPMEGRLEIGAILERQALFATDAQKRGLAFGETVFDELKQMNALVLGPNVGQLLHDNQCLIPAELRSIVLMFWGKVYRDDRSRRVRHLYWNDERWVWDCAWIDGEYWYESNRTVVLARKS